MLVSEVMAGPVQTCGQDASIAEVARRMIKDEHGALAVTLHDYLVGVITERDMLRVIADERDANAATVGEYMTPDPDSLEPDVEVADAADWMLAAGYRHLPVAESGKLLGMVSMKDIMWAITGAARESIPGSGHGSRN